MFCLHSFNSKSPICYFVTNYKWPRNSINPQRVGRRVEILRREFDHWCWNFQELSTHLTPKFWYLGPVYTGPDKFLYGQKLARFQVGFTRNRRNWTNFWTVKCACLGPEKSRSTFWPSRFQFRMDSCKHPSRATFSSYSAVKAWYLVMFLLGCLAKVKKKKKRKTSGLKICTERCKHQCNV